MIILAQIKHVVVTLLQGKKAGKKAVPLGETPDNLEEEQRLGQFKVRATTFTGNKNHISRESL